MCFKSSPMGAPGRSSELFLLGLLLLKARGNLVWPAEARLTRAQFLRAGSWAGPMFHIGSSEYTTMRWSGGGPDEWSRGAFLANADRMPPE